MRLVLLALLLCVLTLARAAGAQAPPPPPGEDAYQRHMDNGIKLYNEGQWDGAIAEFEAAYEASPRASPLINLALTYKKMRNPAKAIEVLRAAIAKHTDTMPADQREAAEREIRELEALLAWVQVKITPPTATLYVDDRPVVLEGGAGELALSPGTRNLRAEAPGFEPARREIKVTSGRQNAAVELSLVSDRGELVVTVRSGAWIRVDEGKPQQGVFQEKLPPGVHSVEVTRDGERTVLHVMVGAGKQVTVTEDEDGGLVSEAAVEKPGADQDGEEDIRRGFYFTGGIAALTAFPQATTFTPDEGERFGIAGDLHIGYRVTDWAGFEVGGQYSDIRVHGTLAFDKTPTERLESTDAKMVLQSWRAGAFMRIILPGRFFIRFISTVGIGLAIEELSWQNPPDPEAPVFQDTSGVGFFGQVDLGVELEVEQVLIDVLMQNSLQSTKHFDQDNGENVFETKPILIAGPTLRAGYGIW
jgi:hypothetical protein